MIRSNEQRRAMFARMQNQFVHRTLDPFNVTEMDQDSDMDGIPLAIDVSPLGNMAMKSGMTPLGPIPIAQEDNDGDGVGDMADLNPDGNFADRMDAEVAPYIRPGMSERRDFGDRFAAGILRLWPGDGGEAPKTVLGSWAQNVGRLPLEERVAHMGEGFAAKVAGLYPGGDGVVCPNLEYRVAHMGEGFATKMAGLYPESRSELPLDMRMAHIGEGLAEKIARLWP